MKYPLSLFVAASLLFPHHTIAGETGNKSSAKQVFESAYIDIVLRRVTKTKDGLLVGSFFIRNKNEAPIFVSYENESAIAESTNGDVLNPITSLGLSKCNVKGSVSRPLTEGSTVFYKTHGNECSEGRKDRFTPIEGKGRTKFSYRWELNGDKHDAFDITFSIYVSNDPEINNSKQVKIDFFDISLNQ